MSSEDGSNVTVQLNAHAVATSRHPRLSPAPATSATRLSASCAPRMHYEDAYICALRPSFQLIYLHFILPNLHLFLQLLVVGAPARPA
ncbi:hypothetical protein BD309DRAFT_945780 [Dichomitus squalens]|nr:hypothetical protein BD309DRAFT_945780 [Dichomitus squalens]